MSRNKKGLSFFSLLYNANNRQANTQGEANKKRRFVDIWAADKEEKDSGLIILSFNIILALFVPLALAICFHCLLSAFSYHNVTQIMDIFPRRFLLTRDGGSLSFEKTKKCLFSCGWTRHNEASFD